MFGLGTSEIIILFIVVAIAALLLLAIRKVVMSRPQAKSANRWWWPEIVDLASADAAAKSGYQSALVVAVATLLIATISMAMGHSILGIDGRAYVDAALFGVVAWGIKRFSRGFAVLGLLVFVAERAWMFSTGGFKNPGAIIVTAALFFGFVSGVRGTLAHHRLQPTGARAFVTKRRIGIAVGLMVGLAAFSFFSETVLACFTDDPTSSSCDTLRIGGDSPKTRLRRAQDAVAARVLIDPAWQGILTSATSDGLGDSKVATLASRGMHRLDFVELAEWNRLRLAMAQASPEACAQMWSGSLNEKTLENALLQLSANDMNAWYSLRFDAASRELRGEPTPPADEAAIKDGFRFVRDSLEPTKERDTLLSLLAKLDRLSPGDACSLQKAAMTGVSRMPRPLAERFLRALAAAQQ